MSQAAITVEGLGKKYRLGAISQPYKTLRESLTGAAAAPLRAGRRLARVGPAQNQHGHRPEFWALRDVAFGVERGEVLGIIGRNGAGKSTVLKILSRITEPTEGEVRIKGRVASLLEVGTGFNPELTGRDNVYLNGAILGMTRAEISRKFDEIVAFAQVEDFIDTQVKRFSSGMYLRLAFAVAAHLDPEILIVDEVLAVGDASFQKKCLDKMGAIGGEGRTVIFVSHNMNAVTGLCERAILFAGGRVVSDGPAADIVESYLRDAVAEQSEQRWQDPAHAPGDENARLCRVAIVNAERVAIGRAYLEDDVFVEIDYQVTTGGTVLNTSISLFRGDGTYVLACHSMTDPLWYQMPHPPGTYRSSCRIPGSLLNEGRYHVDAMLVQDGARPIAHAERAAAVEMVDTGDRRGGFFGHWGGAVRPILDWETAAVDSSDPVASATTPQRRTT